MRPILLDLPDQILTPRLIIRHPSPGDGEMVNAAIKESLEYLRPWVPFAKTMPTVEESEEVARRGLARWILREDLLLWIIDRETGLFLGGTGLHRINWDVPSFEIGYWIRKSHEGRGLVTESVIALTRFAFDALGAIRVEIKIDPANARSLASPRRLGYTEEGILRRNSVNCDGDPRDTVVFSRLNADGLPEIEISWSI
jgi:RimJ/RimL family protein N-acetyltransferase